MRSNWPRPCLAKASTENGATKQVLWKSASTAEVSTATSKMVVKVHVDTRAALKLAPRLIVGSPGLGSKDWGRRARV